MPEYGVSGAGETSVTATPRAQAAPTGACDNPRVTPMLLSNMTVPR